MNDARARNEFHQHLQQGTSTNPQPENARCPSSNPYGIECPCVDASPANRLHPSRGANLIVVPPSIIGIWVQQTAKCLVGGDPLLGAWALRCRYTKGKIPRYVPHVEKEDRARSSMLSSGPNQFHEEASNTVVITTKKCYQVHVKDVFDEWVRQGRRHIKKCAIATFGWGRVCVDEAHEKVHADRERGINT